MMLRYLLIGTCAVLLAAGGVALAQVPPGAPGPDGPHGPPMGPDDHGDMMEHMHHHHGHFMPHGTAFHFKKGDMEVDIACSERESVQSCVSAAATLLDKLGSAPAKTR